MRKLKIYLDSSVISHLDNVEPVDWVTDTHKLWDEIKSGKYDVVLSSVDFLELGNCTEEKRAILAGYIAQITFEHIEVTDEINNTAERFIDLGILTRKSFIDCQHIAVAIHAGCDIIVSWNFKHIVNVKTIKGAKVVTAIEGFKDILICSPNMLFDGGND